MKRLQLSFFFVSALAVVAATGCDDEADDGDDGDDGDVQFLNDNEIVEVLVTAFDGESDVVNAAQDRVVTNDVQAFAQDLITSYNAERDELDTVIEESNFELGNESTTSDDWIEITDQMLDDVNAAGVTNVDRTFLNGQIDFHDRFLNELDSDLIEAANDNDLVDYLEQFRDVVEGHLNTANTLLDDLGEIPAE